MCSLCSLCAGLVFESSVGEWMQTAWLERERGAGGGDGEAAMDAVAAALGAPAVDVAATIAAVAVVCTLVVLAVGLVHAGKKAHTAAVARYERERVREGRARRTALTRGGARAAFAVLWGVGRLSRRAVCDLETDANFVLPLFKCYTAPRPAAAAPAAAPLRTAGRAPRATELEVMVEKYRSKRDLLHPENGHPSHARSLRDFAVVNCQLKAVLQQAQSAIIA